MLYKECIENLLQLKDVIVTNIECIGKQMHVHLRKRRHVCPKCGKRFDEHIDFLPR